jgi:hypothetical protein
MNRRAFLTSVGMPSLSAVASLQPRYVDGVFVHSGQAPIELLAYAERAGTGQLRLVTASFEDVPVVDRVFRVLCSLPTWKPVLVWASTKAIFRNEYTNRRQLPFGGRQVNVYTVELRIADVEEPDRTAKLVRALRATEEEPAYLFITMSNGSVTRDYMVQLSAAG